MHLVVHVGAIGRLQEFDRSEARDGLNDAGFVDGRNVVIELPAGPGGAALPALALELVTNFSIAEGQKPGLDCPPIRASPRGAV